jgi:hypothetical protein
MQVLVIGLELARPWRPRPVAPRIGLAQVPAHRIARAPSSLAIVLTDWPCRYIILISTACSWVNIDGQKTASFAQLGQIHFGGVGQFCIGGNS